MKIGFMIEITVIYSLLAGEPAILAATTSQYSQHTAGRVQLSTYMCVCLFVSVSLCACLHACTCFAVNCFSCPLACSFSFTRSFVPP